MAVGLSIRCPLGVLKLLPGWLLACSSTEPYGTCLDAIGAPLFGGSIDAGSALGPETGAFERGVGRASFETESDGVPVVGTCTVTRIAPDWALTAAHCVGDGAEPTITLNFARDQRETDSACSNAAKSTVDVIASERHPYADLLLLRVAEAKSSSILVSYREVLAGSDVVMVGYGLRENFSQGVREVLKAKVTKVDAEQIRVSAGPEAGACVGDSGGPLLRVASNGEPELVGVLSTGSPTCTGFDDYLRVETFKDWISQALN